MIPDSRLWVSLPIPTLLIAADDTIEDANPAGVAVDAASGKGDQSSISGA